MAWVAGFIDWIGMIPPAFWGVLVGSLLSLGGVMLTNRAKNARLRIQFAQD